MKPGSAMTAKTPGAASTIMNRMFKATSKVKTTGTFKGKSNALGHGGRAAQLKAQGVPGGVIGNLARAAHAAPGQANFHGKKSAIRKKSSMEGGVQTRGSTSFNYGATKSGGTTSAATPGYKPSVSVSPSTGWMSGGKPLKGAKRKKATKLENDAVYKKVPKKKVANKAKKMSAECE